MNILEAWTVFLFLPKLNNGKWRKIFLRVILANEKKHITTIYLHCLPIRGGFCNRYCCYRTSGTQENNLVWRSVNHSQHCSYTWSTLTLRKLRSSLNVRLKIGAVSQQVSTSWFSLGLKDFEPFERFVSTIFMRKTFLRLASTFCWTKINEQIIKLKKK